MEQAPMFWQEDGMIDNGHFLKWLFENKKFFSLVKTNKQIEFYNIPSAFDIETSSFYDFGEKRAIMYEWTFGIFNKVTYGRTWEDFIDLLTVISHILELSHTKRLLCYVHNLPYEFQFMRKRIGWDNVFLLDDLKPVYAISNYGIEFRCSLKLSNKSLDNTAKDLTKYPVKKMIGDLDYSLIRTPLTPLSEKELKYCENDVRVLLSYIQEKIENDGDITRIPLTNTGYVRGYCRQACFPELEEIFDPYEDFDPDSARVCGIARVFSRGIYSRKRPEGRSRLERSWELRLHEFLSISNDCGEVPYEYRENPR